MRLVYVDVVYIKWLDKRSWKIDVYVIYYDLMSTFDKLPEDKLITKLMEIGVHPSATLMVDNFNS